MRLDTSFLDWDAPAVLLLRDDWDVLEKAIEEYKIKTILEFGSGFSTRLFHAKGLRIISYEQSPEQAAVVEKRCPGIDMRLYDGSILKGPTAQMVFIDGPWCDGSEPQYPDRRNAYASAVCMGAKIIACHDAERPGDWALEKEFVRPYGRIIETSRICHVYEMSK